MVKNIAKIISLAIVLILLGFFGATFLFNYLTRKADIFAKDSALNKKLEQQIQQIPSLTEAPRVDSVKDSQAPFEEKKVLLVKEQSQEKNQQEDKKEPTQDLQKQSLQQTLPESPSLPSLVLGGIFFDEEGGSLVIINNRIAKEGVYIEGAKINKIYKDKVELDKDGYIFYLKVN